ncbi:MAG: hypothetical protein Q9215_004129 [Flavoplaca cf. flavocitrina]
MRTDSVLVLYDAIEDDVESIFGKTMHRFDHDYDQREISVHFSDVRSDNNIRKIHGVPSGTGISKIHGFTESQAIFALRDDGSDET